MSSPTRVGDSDVHRRVRRRQRQRPAGHLNGGRAGRKLGGKGRAARISNALLKRLADDPKVKRVHRDREVTASIARTAITVGAKNVHAQYGYTGAGVGVAVIDSGVTPWHDDLTIANRTGQRVTAFVDFVNNRTTKYDDWGHGTHVAGIIAGNGYDSTGDRAAIAPKASIISLKALDFEGKGRISNIIAALDWAVANRDPVQHPRHQHVARRGRVRELQHRPADARRQARGRCRASSSSPPPATWARPRTASRSTARLARRAMRPGC